VRRSAFIIPASNGAGGRGPTNCATGSTTGLSTDAGSLLNDLNAIRPPSCSEAAGRFLGLSFAGWNVIAATGLMLLALKGALTTRR
jgi:disulfide bond formation protein DsbB